MIKIDKETGDAWAEGWRKNKKAPKLGPRLAGLGPVLGLFVYPHAIMHKEGDDTAYVLCNIEGRGDQYFLLEANKEVKRFG